MLGHLKDWVLETCDEVDGKKMGSGSKWMHGGGMNM